MRFEVGSATDQGMVRETNQDRFLITKGFVAVADGMGGHAGGELAAETAVEELLQSPNPRDASDMIDAIHRANREVLAAADRTGMTNMGTTVVAALLRPERRSVTVANVGDSRAYLFRQGELSQVTRDHSLVEDLVRSGKITEAEARDHPHRNVVTRVLGIGEDPEVDIFDLDVSAGDSILLASDGLFNEVDHQVLATILSNEDNLDEAAGRLVERANQNGGKDNITVVIVRFVDESPAIGEPQSAKAIAGLDETRHSDSRSPGAAIEAAGKAPPSAGTVTILGVDDVLGGDPDADAADLLVPVVNPALDSGSVFGGQAADDPDASTQEIPIVAGAQSKRPKRKRGRFLMLLIGVLAIVGIAVGGAISYANSAWFIDTEASEVVIFQGRPGGLLFVEPQAVQRTGINLNDLNPASRGRVGDVPAFSSLDDAEAFVEALELSALRTGD